MQPHTAKNIAKMANLMLWGILPEEYPLYSESRNTIESLVCTGEMIGPSHLAAPVDGTRGSASRRRPSGSVLSFLWCMAISCSSGKYLEMCGERRLGDAEDVGFKTFPVLLAVPMEAGIIGPMLAMLSQKLNLGFLPRLACHNKTVEGSRSGKFLVIRERSILLVKKGL